MDSAPFTPGSGDAAIEMLREIFGPAINGILGGSTAGAENAAANMLGTAFGFFNSGIMFFGAIILTWVTVFGVANTANDGQVLGRKWSTFYTPLRTFSASAFIIPGASGYSAVQLAILLIVTWSVGFASNMWGKVVDYVVDTTTVDQVMRSIVDDKQFDKIALHAFEMKVCALAVNQGVNQTTGLGVNLQLAPPRYQTVSNGTTKTYRTFLAFRDPKWPGSEEICGGMVLQTTFMEPDTNRSTVNQATGTLQTEIADMQGAIGNLRYQAAMDLFGSSGAVMSLANELVRVADTPGAQFSASRLRTVIDQQRESMLKGIRAEVERKVGAANAPLKAKFKEGGWVMAGALHRELAAVKDGIQKAMTTRQEFVQGSYSADHLLGPGNAVSEAVKSVMGRYTSLTGFVLQKLDQGKEVEDRKPTDMPALRTGLGPSDFADGGTGVKTQVTAWFNALPNWAMSGLVFYLAEDGSDPVMQVKNIGDYMAVFAETLLLTKATLVATVDGLFEGSKAAATQSILGTNVAGLMAAGPGILKFILTMAQELWSMISPGVHVILYGGYFLGMWIPMIPFYVFALGVIGWLVQVIEAMAAGALWMVMHLTPAREDSFIGSQQQGYLLLMSLFARPPLMVLGMVASMAILVPAIRFVNAGYMLSFRIIQADSVTGLLSLGGFALIYCVIVFGVFMLTFSLPQTLPDRILRWIGAGIADLGEQNTMGRIESGASGQAKAAVLASAARMAAGDQERKQRNVRKAYGAGEGELDGVQPAGNMPEGHTR